MSSCVLFACSIKPGREFVLKRFLDSFEKIHKDSDIYIAISPSENKLELKTIISKYKLNTFVRYVQPELHSDSDASGYQLCLKMISESGKNYYNYWFIHTKSGFNSHSYYLRDWYIYNFIYRRSEIENVLNCNPNIGSYGILGLEYDRSKPFEDCDVEINLWKNILTPELPYPNANFFYIHTMYCISNKPINKFFNLVTDTWFNTKLDRYYFEGVFPFIVSRSGYFPYLENRISTSGKDLLYYIESWVRENKLNQYEHLIDSFKTNYSFNQLEPPYVNSNTQS